MSDKLKSDYTKYMESIEPSDEFLSQLTQKLKNEQIRQKKMHLVKQLSIAACFVMVISLSAIFYSYHQNDKQVDEDNTSVSGDIHNYAENMDTEWMQTTPFKNIDWYDDSLTNESLPRALAQKLSSALDYLSYSNENKFVKANQADAKQVEQIIKLLSEIEESREETSGTKVYYMAVFTDGTIAKFSIVNDVFVEIAGDEMIYKKAEE